MSAEHQAQAYICPLCHDDHHRERSPCRPPFERRHPEFLDWVRAQGCFLAPFGECQGRTEPHHAGQRGVGLKSADIEAVPLCTKHHRQYHDHNGRFRHQTRAELLAWRAYAIEQTQAGYLRARESVELVPF